jgi:hypothetical protein
MSAFAVMFKPPTIDIGSSSSKYTPTSPTGRDQTMHVISHAAERAQRPGTVEVLSMPHVTLYALDEDLAGREPSLIKHLST